MTTKGRIQLSVVTFCLLLFLLVAQLTRIQNGNDSTVIQTLAHKVKQIGQYQRNDDIKHGYQEPEGLRPCGEICSYQGKIVQDDGGLFPEMQKDINCDNIMQRMSFKNHPVVYPPPEVPPDDMFDEFTMFGRMPILRQWYKRDEITDEKPAIFYKEQVDSFVERVKRNDSVNVYYGGECVQVMLAKYADKLKGKRGVVIGTQLPWMEAILLANDASFVTTLEYRNTTYPDHPQLEAYTPYEFADKYAAGNSERFDFAATFSSLEHSGLGRYTDPLNPYGDLEAAAQVWCMVKPGGMFALGVPGGKTSKENRIAWNAHRMYGPERLQHLAANWQLVDSTFCAIHHFLILIKPID